MQKSTFSIGEKTLTFNVTTGTCAPNGVDISNMYRDAGIVTYDPGFVSTASCKSQITYIDGEKGILRYRGYDIKDLSEKNVDFISAAYLLLNRELPNSNEKNIFYQELVSNMELPEECIKLIHSFKKSAHPMPILVAVFAALAAYYNDEKVDQGNLAIAKMPSAIAHIYRYLYADGKIYKSAPQKSFAENFFHMMFGEVDTTFASALDKILLLHADHEQNASTSTARMTASSGASTFISVSSAISTLSGPLHGGANEAVIVMLEEIKKDGNVQIFIDRAKDKNDTFKLMGFGHRVYRDYDPRAKILRNICGEVLQKTGNSDEKILLDIAMKLENVALTDKFFIDRKLYPNVDFYSGIMLKAMGIPVPIFTLIFALARIVGWVAQVKELRLDKEQKIARPRQIYIGPALRTISEAKIEQVDNEGDKSKIK